MITPGGTLLGSANTRSVRKLSALLRDAFAAFDALEPSERGLDAPTAAALAKSWRWEDEFPEDGLVLVVRSRDLARAEVEAPDDRRRRGRRRRWRDWTAGARNLDYAWFTRDEAAALAPTDPTPGTVYRLPTAFVERLARFHFVDNVRGQTAPFSSSSLTHAELTATVVRVGNEGDVELEFEGRSEAIVESNSAGRSMRLDLSGSAAWDPASASFARFSLTAIGERSGGTRFNARERDQGPAGIGFTVDVLPPDGPRIAPAFIWSYGWPRR